METNYFWRIDIVRSNTSLTVGYRQLALQDVFFSGIYVHTHTKQQRQYVRKKTHDSVDQAEAFVLDWSVNQTADPGAVPPGWK